MSDPWQAQREALGTFIRAQRKMANLSLRQLAELTSLSNPYLSQIERGLHQPSVRVLKALSDALNVSAETLLAQAGLIDAVTGEASRTPDTAAADTPANTPRTRDEAATPSGAVGEAASPPPSTEEVIRADERLTEEQRAALIAVYRSMLG